MTFENANSESEGVIRALKARSAPIEKWIRNTADIGSHDYDSTWIGELTSKNFKKNQRDVLIGVNQVI